MTTTKSPSFPKRGYGSAGQWTSGDVCLCRGRPEPTRFAGTEQNRRFGGGDAVRGVNTHAVLDTLGDGLLTGYGADVYEGGRGYFHQDFSNKTVSDDLLNRLRRHPKVLLTAHQGFLTEEALRQIVRSLLNQFSFHDNQQASLTTKASMY